MDLESEFTVFLMLVLTGVVIFVALLILQRQRARSMIDAKYIGRANGNGRPKG